MALGARCCQLAGRCRPVHPPHRTHEAAGLGDPGKAARGAGRGGHAGPPRSPEPAVVPQPPGRSRWDPREAWTLGASPKPLRRVGVGAFVVCVLPLSAVATWGHRPSLRTLCKARSRRRPPASAPPGASSQRRRAAWPRQRARRRRRRSGAERGLARKGALPAPALTFEDRAELLQGHVPQRRRSESARGGGAVVTARRGSFAPSPSPAAAAS